MRRTTWFLAAVLLLWGCNDGALTAVGANAPTPPGGDPAPAGDDTESPGDEDCTYTQGYWKNHPDDWPVGDLEIGGTVYDQPSLLDLLDLETGGDGSLILGHQLIAALLNVLNGAPNSASVAAALADAESWMGTYRDADGALPYGVVQTPASGFDPAVALSAVLDDFNNGLAGTPHCDDHESGDID